jgi:hypothetical protein
MPSKASRKSETQALARLSGQKCLKRRTNAGVLFSGSFFIRHQPDRFS